MIKLADDHHRIIKRLVFRLVRKHVAGTTTSSAIRTAATLSGRGLLPTVTFLSDHVNTQLNARYNINAYIELARQLSRQSIRADLSVRLSQLGYFISKDGARAGAEEILGSLGPGSKLWLESEQGIGPGELAGICEEHAGMPAGFEMPASLLYNGTAEKYLGAKNRYIKLTTNNYAMPDVAAKGARKRGKHYDDMLDVFSRSIDRLARKNRVVTVAGQDERLMLGLFKANKGHRRDLIFEVPLGYNQKRVGMLLKLKANVSVYVTYGKDWIPYAINRLTEGRIRDIAVAVLNGEHKVVGNA
ncbi:hypothetical protein M1329_00025 [Candidatus Marsarchaeota archaeon]|nr:hypothetical protein [Candidatus Marsarchaeota archaeon]